VSVASQSPSSQRHTARFLGSEVRIWYPFHPRAGQVVQVVARSSRGGTAHLTIVQSDGTLAKIPTWMTEERSGAAAVVRDPALSAAALLEVRAMLDGSLRLAGGESSPVSGGKNDSNQSSSTASVRCDAGSRNDPTGSPTAPSDPHRDALERSRGRWSRQGGGRADPVSGKGDEG
jgi:hypothetical protein